MAESQFVGVISSINFREWKSDIFQENFEDAFEDLQTVIDDYKEAVRPSWAYSM